MTPLRIRGRDSLLFRDGRPFSAAAGANVARTLDAPLPATLAGMIRTTIGEAQEGRWDAERVERVRQIAVHGPLIYSEEELLFPRPGDALRVKSSEGGAAGWSKLRPSEDWTRGCKMPEGMLPLRMDPARDGKPDQEAYWREEHLTRWLVDGTLPEDGYLGVPGPKREERIHVAIDSGKRKVRDGMLFAAEYLDVDGWSYLARAETAPPAGPIAFGGERRLALIETEGAIWPQCPEEVCTALRGQRCIRMVLATPALFAHGWRPGWTTPPPVEGLRLTLVAAAIDRRVAVTGWDLESRQAKAVRWAAPAGSVYFFRVDAGDPTLLADAWLAPVSDDLQDRRDGFGLALWGIGDF